MKIGRALILLSSALATFCRQGVAATTDVGADPTLNKVVIDAGHGGKDPGAIWGNIKEKNINLAVALRLGALIEQYYPQVQVTYTRRSDVFVELNNRGAIANKAKADLFISIHTNSSKGPAPSGSETFVMGLDKTGKSLDVAMRENDVITYEKDYTSKYEGYEPGSPESFIIFNLMQYSYLEQSLALASLVEYQYRQTKQLPSHGVRQGPFLVLWHPAMPSILTEVGFINNTTDSKVITSPEGQEAIARAIFNAFSAYKARVDGKGKPIVLTAKGGKTVAASGGGGQAASPGAVAGPSTASGPALAPSADIDTTSAYADADSAAPASTPTVPNAAPARTAPAAKTPAAVQPAPRTAPKTTPKSVPKAAAAASKGASQLPVKTPPSAAQPAAKPGGIVFAVQLCASITRVSPQDAILKPFGKDVYEYKEDKWYRYYIGSYQTYDQALAMQQKAQKTAKDAFVVALRDGKKIPVEQARKLTEK